MTTSIWDSGPVAASVCCSTCERCGRALQKCVQIIVIEKNERVTLCMPCLCVLSYEVGRADGREARRQCQ
jgi:hypothetical protein